VDPDPRATEAAGEGINLQVCTSSSTTTSLEPEPAGAADGRITATARSRTADLQLRATNTIEGKVLQRLLEKLQRSGTPSMMTPSSTWW